MMGTLHLLSFPFVNSISGLVVEYIVAIDVTRVRFPADALLCCLWHTLALAGRLPQKWTHWDLNPGPSACEADVIPLHHVPLIIVVPMCSMRFSVSVENGGLRAEQLMDHNSQVQPIDQVSSQREDRC